MKLNNKIMLITYPDSLGGNLAELSQVLKLFGSAVGGVHILPFFPSSADRGFAPERYDMVDPRFGTYQDVEAIGRNHNLMFDFMVNHISRGSAYFRDFAEKRDQSKYRNFFIRYKDFWPSGEPTAEQLNAIYRRKPRAPYIEIAFSDGASEKLWCTFGDEQVDLNVNAPVTREFFRKVLTGLCGHGASVIRLDAFAYAVKKAGTSCFFVEPEIWDLLHAVRDIVKPFNVEILPEIHEHYRIQHKISDAGFWIYDFALPMLVLHALYSGDGRNLAQWIKASPRKQFTTLDTHDGIGVVDVKDLLTDEQIEFTKQKMFSNEAGVKKIYNTPDYNNLDIYQVNTTYYSALGNDDQAYLLARAVQFFAPGIPQVYYVGMLAGRNDAALAERTKNGRDINRHGYSTDEVIREMGRPVVQRLLRLMEFRNAHPAFSLNADIQVTLRGKGELTICRTQASSRAVLKANLGTHAFTIEHT